MAVSHSLSLKSRLADAGDKAVFTAWCQWPGEWQALALVRAGFAGVLADMQHGMTDYGQMLAHVQAVGRAGGVPMVRPPLDDFGMVARALDAGASVILERSSVFLSANVTDVTDLAISRIDAVLGEGARGEDRSVKP